MNGPLTRIIRQKPILTRIFLISLLVSIFCGEAMATQITLNFSGVITSGSDTNGMFGAVGRDLTGLSYSAEMSYDPSEFFLSLNDYECGGDTIVYCADAPNAITITVTIGGVTKSSTNITYATSGTSRGYTANIAINNFPGVNQVYINACVESCIVDDRPYYLGLQYEYLTIGNIDSLPTPVQSEGLGIGLGPGPGNYIVATISSAKKPEIIYKGTDIAGTTTPPSVVVGQQVALDAELPKSFGTVASQEWIVGGKPIGGYSPTTASFKTGSVSALVTDQPKVKIYWTVPTDSGAYYTVKYRYTLQSGQSGTVETKFSVMPPPVINPQDIGFYEKTTGSSCAIDPSYCDIYQAVNPKTKIKFLAMGFGNNSAGTDNYGMAVGVDVDAGNGSYSWVQLIKGVSYIWSEPTGKQTSCDVSAGLDTTYPYSFGIGTYVDPTVIKLQNVVSSTSDQPKIDLVYYHPHALQVSMGFKAKMFLMWQSNTLPSIPIPLGSVTWSFGESSINGADGWTTPTVKSEHGEFSTDVSTYPEWQSLATTPNKC